MRLRHDLQIADPLRRTALSFNLSDNFWRGPRVVRRQLLATAAPHDARQSLRDLARLNRWLGGHAVIRYLFRRVVRSGDAFSLLDVGAASGDSGRVIRKSYPNATVVSLDKNPLNLQGASEPRTVGDAFTLPFADRSFDFVFCSLFLHHFSEDEAVILLREFARVARRALLISDVERHKLASWFLPASRWLCRWHWMTVHDGTVSVRSAFTPGEMSSLARQANLKDVSVAAHRPAFRLSMIGWIEKASKTGKSGGNQI